MPKLAVASALALLAVAAISLPDGPAPDSASAAAPAAVLHVVQNAGRGGGGSVTVQGPGQAAVACEEGFFPNNDECRFTGFSQGDTVTLTATATAPTEFKGWSDERCPSGPVATCTLTLADEQTVVALFTPLAIDVSPTGGDGTVTITDPTGLTCQANVDCTTFALNSVLTLVARGATADAPMPRFNPADCDSLQDAAKQQTCTLTLVGRDQVNVSFDGQAAPTEHGPPRVDVIFRARTTGSGSGTIRGTLDCGGRCSVKVPFRKAVTLIADEAAGSRFVGWKGGCGTVRTCKLQATATAVSAEFAIVPAADTAKQTPPPPVAPSPGAFTARIGKITTSGRLIRIPVGVSARASMRVNVLRGSRQVARKLVVLARGASVLRVRVPRGTRAGRYRLALRIRAQGSSTSLVFERNVRLRR